MSAVGQKRTSPGPARHDGLEDLFKRDAICLDIVTYLSRHTEAVDTARGIADWWINREPRGTEEALVKLLRHGVVRSLAVQGTICVYAYTKDPGLRQWLSRYVGSRPATRDPAPGRFEVNR